MIKTNLNSIIIGIKKGYLIDTLPIKVRLFLDLPVIRILRVIGGISVLLYLLNKNGIISFNIPYNLNMIIIILALVQLVQIVIISIIKLVYSLNKIIRHRKELEVRNSPLNRLATITANLVYCWKIGCQVGSTGVGLLGTSVLIDGALSSSGHEKIFEPLINKGINGLVGTRSVKDVYAELAQKANKLNLDSEKHSLLVKEIEASKTSVTELVKNKIFSEEDGNNIKEGLDEIRNSDYSALKKRAGTLHEEYLAEYKKRFEKK